MFNGKRHSIKLLKNEMFSTNSFVFHIFLNRKTKDRFQQKATYTATANVLLMFMGKEKVQ